MFDARLWVLHPRRVFVFAASVVKHKSCLHNHALLGTSADEGIHTESYMKSVIAFTLLGCALFVALPARAQVKMTRDQMLFYTSDWKGDRFPDGRPKVSDDLLKRVVDISIEDIWDFLREMGYRNQFESGWQALHIEKPFAGRALTAQYMPTRPDMIKAIQAEGKAEGRVGGNNMWPINECQIGDVYVADGFGKIVEGTLIGSNLGNAVAAHTHTGFVFDAGIRDQEENREIPNFNGFYRGYDPSAWADMGLTAINAPIRIGRAVVLPGDLVLAKPEGVLFIPAILAEEAISTAEFTGLKDDYNFELNREGKNGAEFEGGWTNAKYDGFAKWIGAHPDKLKMSRAEFDAMLAKAKEHADH
jgi:regulator of RNase E activity RraA